MNHLDLGKQGEDIACEYLEDLDYSIVTRNFRTKAGEIDIIAYRDGVIAFIEVKTRRNKLFGRAAEAVDYRRQERLRNTANLFYKMYENNMQVIDIFRFDVIEVYINNEIKIQHVKNAF